MGSKLFTSLSWVFLLAATPISVPEAWSYTHTLTQDGKSVRHSGNPRLNVVGNERNRSGIDPADFFSLVTRSLQRWREGSDGIAQFDYWQGTDPAVYIPSSAYNGISSIYFASQSGEALSSNVIGVTQIWYDTQTGEILETDIALNDVAFRFTNNPRDTAGFGGSTLPTRDVYLGNILTHELGHALGLAHSGSLQSSLFFLEGPEQAVLSCDDQRGVKSIYGVAEADTGELRARVRLSSGAAIHGAQVSAISTREGRVEASALSDASGEVRFSSLPAGEYLLLMEPYYPGADSIPAYYRGTSHRICDGGRAFVRTFSADALQVRPFQVTQAGDLRVECSASTSGKEASVIAAGGGGTSATAVSMAKTDQGVSLSIDRSGSARRYFRVIGHQGPLRVQAMAYSLYSPIRLQLAVRTPSGAVIPGTQSAPVDSLSSSTYRNHDAAWISSASLPLGDYIIEVSPGFLSSSDYPGGSISLDSTPFFVLTARVGSGAAGELQEIARAARCRQPEPVEPYRSPAGGPVRRSTEEKSDGVGFCGSVSSGKGGAGGDRGGPPSASALAGWALPWLLMALFTFGLRNRRAAFTLKG